jgi:chaperonin GroES
MKLQPLADRIVATPVEAASKTAGGLLLPDTAKEKPQAAQVTAVGKDVKEVKVGDQILHSEYGPNRVKIDDQEYLLMKEEDVLAIVKE